MALPECNELADKLMRIHAISNALTRGWHELDPDMRSDTLQRLKARVTEVKRYAGVSSKGVISAEIVLERLDTLDRYNKGEGTIHDIPDKLLPFVLDMAVESILDCGCREVGFIVERDKI